MFSHRSIFVTALALILAGVGGYAHQNPAFAATCKASFKASGACAQRWTEAAKSSLQSTELYTTATQSLRERAGKNYVQPKFKMADLYASVANRLPRRSAPTTAQLAAKPHAGELPDSTAPPQRAPPSVGKQIASGHAFRKHGRELGLATEQQMADQIDRIISRPSRVKHLARGRTAYWNSASGIVVIHDPNTTDGGTAFKPNRGRAYFDNLR